MELHPDFLFLDSNVLSPSPWWKVQNSTYSYCIPKSKLHLHVVYFISWGVVVRRGRGTMTPCGCQSLIFWTFLRFFHIFGNFKSSNHFSEICRVWPTLRSTRPLFIRSVARQYWKFLINSMSPPVLVANIYLFSQGDKEEGRGTGGRGTFYRGKRYNARCYSQGTPFCLTFSKWRCYSTSGPHVFI